MVVAGRVLPDDDVAIMMVEAEATDVDIDLVAGGAAAPDRGGRGRRASRPPSRSSRRCATRSSSWPTRPPRRRGEFPVFLDYQDDVFDAVGRGRPTTLAAGADHRRQAGARGRARPRSRRWPSRRSRPHFAGREKEISAAYRSLTKKLVRQRILTDQVRIDGRGITDIRTLSAEVGVLPRVHGSALFERGETQILGVTTLNMLKHGAADRHAGAGDHQALHAQLQLPAVLDR